MEIIKTPAAELIEAALTDEPQSLGTIHVKRMTAAGERLYPVRGLHVTFYWLRRFAREGSVTQTGEGNALRWSKA